MEVGKINVVGVERGCFKTPFVTRTVYVPIDVEERVSGWTPEVIEFFYEVVKILPPQFYLEVRGTVVQIKKRGKGRYSYMTIGQHEKGGVSVHAIRCKDLVTGKLKLIHRFAENVFKHHFLADHGPRKDKPLDATATYSTFKQMAGDRGRRGLVYNCVHKEDFDKPLSLLKEIIRRD